MPAMNNEYGDPMKCSGCLSEDIVMLVKCPAGCQCMQFCGPCWEQIERDREAFLHLMTGGQ
jgi:hypothetical protein